MSELFRFISAAHGEDAAAGCDVDQLPAATSVLRQLRESLSDSSGPGCNCCGGLPAGARYEIVPQHCLRGLPPIYRRVLRMSVILCGSCHSAAVQSGRQLLRHNSNSGRDVNRIAKVLLGWWRTSEELRDLAERKHAADAARHTDPSDENAEQYRTLRKQLATLIAQRPAGVLEPESHSRKRGMWRKQKRGAKALNMPNHQRETFIRVIGEHLGKPPQDVCEQDLKEILSKRPSASETEGQDPWNAAGAARQAMDRGMLPEFVRHWRRTFVTAVRPASLEPGWDPEPVDGRPEDAASTRQRSDVTSLAPQVAAVFDACGGSDVRIERFLYEFATQHMTLRPRDFGFPTKKALLRAAGAVSGRFTLEMRRSGLYLVGAGGPKQPQVEETGVAPDELRVWADGLSGMFDIRMTGLSGLAPWELHTQLTRAAAAGVSDVLCPGGTLRRSMAAAAVAAQSPAPGCAAVWATAGAAPWEEGPDRDDLLRRMAAGPRCVAIEVLSTDAANLSRHAELAAQLQKPLVVSAQGAPAQLLASGVLPPERVLVRCRSSEAADWSRLGHAVSANLLDSSEWRVAPGFPAHAGDSLLGEPAALPEAVRHAAAESGTAAREVAAAASDRARRLFPCTESGVAASDHEECRFFRETGWCKFGTRCRHIHVDDDGQRADRCATMPAVVTRPQEGALRGLEIDLASKRLERLRVEVGDRMTFLEKLCAISLRSRQSHLRGHGSRVVVDGDAEGCWAALYALGDALGEVVGVAACRVAPKEAEKVAAGRKTASVVRTPICKFCFSVAKDMQEHIATEHSTESVNKVVAAAESEGDGDEERGAAVVAALSERFEDERSFADRDDCRRLLLSLIHRRYPRAELFMFGSSVTGLAVKGSDTDFAVLVDPEDPAQVKVNAKTTVERLHDLLRVEPFAKLTCITRTRVPIVANRSDEVTGNGPHGARFDLSIQLAGVRNSALLRRYFEASPVVRLAAAAAKTWARRVGVIRPRDGYLTPYAVSIMLLYSCLRESDLLPYVPTEDVPSSDRCRPCPPPLPRPDDSSSLRCGVGAALRVFWRLFAVTFDWDAEVVSLNTDPRRHVVTKAELGWADHAADVAAASSSDRLSGQVRVSLREHYHFGLADPYEQRPGSGALNLGRKLTAQRAAEVHAAFADAHGRLTDPGLNELLVAEGPSSPAD